MSLLSSPAKKCFAIQLQKCSPIAKEEQSNEEEWLYQGMKGISFRFHQVWLQGFVVFVSGDGNDIFIDDGTGIVHATGVIKLVKNFSISKGMYVMVAGQLKSTGKDTIHPTIRIVKFADKSTMPIQCETMWMLEVIDAQKTFAM